VQTNDPGNYSVVISNAAGVATSSNAVLTVLIPQPPHIDAITQLPDGHIQLQASGSPGHYVIDGSTNLADWSELTNFRSTNSTFQYTDPQTNFILRFYRVRLIP